MTWSMPLSGPPLGRMRGKPLLLAKNLPLSQKQILGQPVQIDISFSACNMRPVSHGYFLNSGYIQSLSAEATPVLMIVPLSPFSLYIQSLMGFI